MKFKYTAKEVHAMMLEKAENLENYVGQERGRIIRTSGDDKTLDRMEQEAYTIRLLAEHLGDEDIWLEENEVRRLLERVK